MYIYIYICTRIYVPELGAPNCRLMQDKGVSTIAGGHHEGNIQSIVSLFHVNPPWSVSYKTHLSHFANEWRALGCQ